MILEKTYIQEQDLTTCQTLLERALKNKDINRSLIKHPNLWPDVDGLADTICQLEDRIFYLNQVDNLARANEKRWAQK